MFLAGRVHGKALSAGYAVGRVRGRRLGEAGRFVQELDACMIS